MKSLVLSFAILALCCGDDGAVGGGSNEGGGATTGGSTGSFGGGGSGGTPGSGGGGGGGSEPCVQSGEACLEAPPETCAEACCSGTWTLVLIDGMSQAVCE